MGHTEGDTARLRREVRTRNPRKETKEMASDLMDSMKHSIPGSTSWPTEGHHNAQQDHCTPAEELLKSSEWISMRRLEISSHEIYHARTGRLRKNFSSATRASLMLRFNRISCSL
ncbi:late embryogenesis abundant protein [Striga asiatica]|uniref:Late embryogenesis abundant protein n=1 Tax=Striga asiatica TaxID=4170 RepID=A0A5A7QCY7_STRAF|nr:late embryogenesis abundant protein [Striga asiatica]